MIASVIYACGLGFLSRQLAGVLDNMMGYNEIFGFIRVSLAKRIDPEYYAKAMQGLPDDYAHRNIYMKAVYEEVCIINFPFRMVTCQYCMSFWILGGLFWISFLIIPIEHVFIYLLFSISFNDVFFKL